jgi:hypothetical protein
VDQQDPTSLCTLAEVTLAYLYVFVFAAMGLPVALAVTVLPSLALGRLAPPLERKMGGRSLTVVQYVLGASVGAICAAALTDLSALFAFAGAAAGSGGAWAFRRARYGR